MRRRPVWVLLIAAGLAVGLAGCQSTLDKEACDANLANVESIVADNVELAEKAQVHSVVLDSMTERNTSAIALAEKMAAEAGE